MDLCRQVSFFLNWRVENLTNLKSLLLKIVHHKGLFDVIQNFEFSSFCWILQIAGNHCGSFLWLSILSIEIIWTMVDTPCFLDWKEKVIGHTHRGKCNLPHSHGESNLGFSLYATALCQSKKNVMHFSLFTNYGTFSASRTFFMKTVQIRVKFPISRIEYKTGFSTLIFVLSPIVIIL